MKTTMLDQRPHRSALRVCIRSCQSINTTAEAKYFLLKAPNSKHRPLDASSVREPCCTTRTVHSVNTCTADHSALSHGHQTMQECHNYTALALPYFKRAPRMKEVSHQNLHLGSISSSSWTRGAVSVGEKSDDAFKSRKRDFSSSVKEMTEASDSHSPSDNPHVYINLSLIHPKPP